MRRLIPFAALALTVCAEEMPRQSPPEFVEPVPPSGQYPPRSESDQTLSPGTPASGYVDWIADLRRGLARVADLAQTEPETARFTLEELYASRHEYLERYFGSGGAMYMGDGLAQAVDRSAIHFQELMRQLATMDEEPARIEESVRAAEQALYDVEEAARAAGLPPTAPHGGD
jgi:hypothetical protein